MRIYSALARPTASARSGTAHPRLHLLLLGGLSACHPQLDIGERTCSADETSDGKPNVMVDRTAPVAAPWSSGFENGYCDYTELAGFCYTDPSASSEIVSSPVHSGRYAAAFTVQADADGSPGARCVRQGELPTAAYYGAWYFIAESANPTINWNLFHFRGGENLSATHGVLDVSLVRTDQGLQLAVFGVGHASIGEPLDPPPVPIGSWFHVQLYLKRAADMTGEVALYQDGQLLFDATDLRTDDSTLGQWYVGNLASGLSPPASTVYVDDVTISSTL